jgi:UDP-galactopyranose mutase
MSLKSKHLYIVGAGFYGLTIAEFAARELGVKVTILEKRDHIGGNAYSYPDEDTGIQIHKYGTHIFHTNNSEVWNYVNRFTKFNNYTHKVLVNSYNRKISLPITLDTICDLYGRFLSPTEAKALVEAEREQPIESQDDLESYAVGQVGKKIYDQLIYGYTQKQWGKNPNNLPKEIIKRIPVRYNFDTRYFTDQFQGIPLDVYGKLFERMVDNPNIEINLGYDFKSDTNQIDESDLVIYSGPIDRYFNYKHGVLGWRTLDFDFKRLNVEDFQGNSVINYADSAVPYTRIHEFKHLHPENEPLDSTIIAYEFSRDALTDDDPYYPINHPNDRIILQKYRDEIAKIENVVFGGRLGSYQYLDMHMAIASAINTYRTKVKDWFRNGS